MILCVRVCVCACVRVCMCACVCVRVSVYFIIDIYTEYKIYERRNDNNYQKQVQRGKKLF